MVRIRHGWLVAALAISFSTGACKKDEKKAPAAGGEVAKTDKPADVPAEKPPGAMGAVAAAVTAQVNPNASDLALLPVDSEIVLGLNFAQLQKSALWKKFVEPQMMKGDNQEKLAEFKAKCGFDPMSSVQSVSMGLKGLGGSKAPEGVIVVHGPEKSKVMGCMDKMKDEAAKEGSTITRDGDITMVKSKDGETFAFTYVGDTTLLGVIGPNATSAGVKAAAAGTSALKTSQAFVDMYSKINTSESLWVLMNGNSKVFDQAAQMGFKPKAVFGSVNVTDGLSVDMRLRLDTPEQATQITGMATSQVAQFKSMVDKLDIVAEGSDVKLNLALSTQKLEALITQFAGMMGGLGGGGGGMGSP